MPLRRIAFVSLPALAIAAAAACSGSSDEVSSGADDAGGTTDGGYSREAGSTPDSGGSPETGSPDASTCKSGTFAWGTSGGGAGQDDTVNGIAVDKQGNVWVVGTFIGDAKWGNVALTATDKTHLTGFVAKLDATGKVLFARVIGGALDEANQPAKIRVDKDGNAYVAGTFENSFTFDAASVTQDNNGGGGSAYVLKLDASGKAVWAIQSTGAGSDEYGNDVAIDPKNGDVYLVGSYNGQAIFRNGTDGGVDNVTTPQAAGGGESAFVAKYSQVNKRWEWARGWLGPGNDGGYAYAVAVGADDSVAVIGQIQGSISVEGTLLPSEAGTFLVKVAANDGHGLWVSQIDGGGRNNNGLFAIAYAATIDGSGNLYLTGEFNGTALFEAASTVGIDAGTADDAGAGSVSLTATDDDMFVAKIDSTGKPLWAKHGGLANAIARGEDISFDGSGTLYVAGFKQGATVFDGVTAADTGNLFIARYDTSGAIKDVIVNANNNVAGGEGRAISAGAPGSGVFVGGSFVTETSLGTVKLTSAGQDDALVARLCY